MIINGDCLEELDKLDENSVDVIVTDPPYELNFMGKGWDNAGVSFSKKTWEKCLRVLKPGGYLLAFGGTRTYHRIACAIEDAGFEIRDCIMWLYGCLSEDTEVLTDKGFKHFHKITKNDKIRVYDTKDDIYKWERPKKWQSYRINEDTCFHIKSNTTDQIVSKNHRVYVERNGKLVWEFAENLSKMERVPVLSYDIPFIQESESDILFTDLLWQDENVAQKIFCEWQGDKESKEISLRRKKPCLERWSDLSQEKRELCPSKYQVCKMSSRVYDDGEKRWLCNGTQVKSGTSDKTTTFENRSCASYKSQCGGQQVGESNVICNQQRTQTIRRWETYKTTLATITPIKYSGIIFCPSVSTGCFVARRKGKVFLTGNSGFPKSMNIGLAIDKKNGIESKVVGEGKSGVSSRAYQSEETTTAGAYQIKQAQNQWSGWGTALKPSYEPIAMARKPFKGSCVDNVMKWGVGGINIDECRVKNNNNEKLTRKLYDNPSWKNSSIAGQGSIDDTADRLGRFPANTILTYDEADFDEVCGGFPKTKSGKNGVRKSDGFNKNDYGQGIGIKAGMNNGEYGDSGSASRYFMVCKYTGKDEDFRRYIYTPKASKKDRDEGLEDFEIKQCVGGGGGIGNYLKDVNSASGKFGSEKVPHKNIHPTVKPTSLMQYLVRLVAPKGATILDPFMGSGSTGKAVAYENKERNADYKFIGIELDSEYCKIAEARIKYAELDK